MSNEHQTSPDAISLEEENKRLRYDLTQQRLKHIATARALLGESKDLQGVADKLASSIDAVAALVRAEADVVREREMRDYWRKRAEEERARAEKAGALMAEDVFKAVKATHSHTAEDCAQTILKAAKEQSPDKTVEQLLVETIAGSCMLTTELQEKTKVIWEMTERAEKAEDDALAYKITSERYEKERDEARHDRKTERDRAETIKSELKGANLLVTTYKVKAERASNHIDTLLRAAKQPVEGLLPQLVEQAKAYIAKLHERAEKAEAKLTTSIAEVNKWHDACGVWANRFEKLEAKLRTAEGNLVVYWSKYGALPQDERGRKFLAVVELARGFKGELSLDEFWERMKKMVDAVNDLDGTTQRAGREVTRDA